MSLKTGDEIGILELPQHLDGRPSHLRGKCVRIIDDFGNILKSRLEINTLVNRRLSCAAENNGTSVRCREFLQYLQAREQDMGWQCLYLIENHNTVGNVVKLTAAAGFIREQRLEELNVGRNDNWCIPVFC
ncbi:MAG: hypothetical protein Kow0074_04360 [Candidatus Zixiibacteriota bacterium]